MGALGTGRVPGMFSLSCLRGACCEDFRADLPAQFPSEVRYVALYSRTDGIVDWRACLDPAADSRSRSAPRTSAWASTAGLRARHDARAVRRRRPAAARGLGRGRKLARS